MHDERLHCWRAAASCDLALAHGVAARGRELTLLKRLPRDALAHEQQRRDCCHHVRHAPQQRWADRPRVLHAARQAVSQPLHVGRKAAQARVGDQRMISDVQEGGHRVRSPTARVCGRAGRCRHAQHVGRQAESRKRVAQHAALRRGGWRRRGACEEVLDIQEELVHAREQLAAGARRLGRVSTLQKRLHAARIVHRSVRQRRQLVRERCGRQLWRDRCRGKLAKHVWGDRRLCDRCSLLDELGQVCGVIDLRRRALWQKHGVHSAGGLRDIDCGRNQRSSDHVSQRGNVRRRVTQERRSGWWGGQSDGACRRRSVSAVVHRRLQRDVCRHRAVLHRLLQRLSRA